MSALVRLMIAGAAAALFSAPVVAMDKTSKLETAQVTAQQGCTGWGVRCELDVTPQFCIADGKCAVALPGSALVRYDQRMDVAAGH